MAVVQEAFDIPTDIMTKLSTGEYRRYCFLQRKGRDRRNERNTCELSAKEGSKS